MKKHGMKDIQEEGKKSKKRDEINKRLKKLKTKTEKIERILEENTPKGRSRSDQKRKLKALAHHLDPVVMVGQKGFTESLAKAVDRALSDHELIKIRFVDFKDEKRELTDEIVSSLNAGLVGIIGNIAILYRENPDLPQSERIKL